MELEIPSTEEPVATRRNSPLAVSDVDHMFLYQKCNKTVPFRPKGGEVYVFRPDDSSEINDWVSDGHMFSCEGTRKIKGRIGAQNLIHSQFPNIDGLQSCCYAQKPCFRSTTDTFIQILNTHPKGGGLHWVTVPT